MLACESQQMEMDDMANGIVRGYKFEQDTLDRFCDLNAVLKLQGYSLPGLPCAPQGQLFFDSKNGRFVFTIQRSGGMQSIIDIPRKTFYDTDLSKLKWMIIKGEL